MCVCVHRESECEPGGVDRQSDGARTTLALQQFALPPSHPNGWVCVCVCSCESVCFAVAECVFLMTNHLRPTQLNEYFTPNSQLPHRGEGWKDEGMKRERERGESGVR